jgi:pyruvate/2-oxoglutarate dehydrogenase complex dihydrolipoamide acyltransferase (E2) component
VQAGQVICIVEAMKMENEVRAPRAGTVSDLSISPGQPVTTGQVICVLTSLDGSDSGRAQPDSGGRSPAPPVPDGPRNASAE